MSRNNLAEFGLKELDEAGRLLIKLSDSPTCDAFMADKLELHFNPHSGNVFLYDEDECRVWMLDSDEKIDEMLNCPECGYEELSRDFETALKEDTDDIEECCATFFNEWRR